MNSTAALAQGKPPYGEDAYRFTVSLSIASEDAPAPFSLPLVFAGIGSGAWTVDATSSTNPVLYEPSPGQDRRLFLAGLAHDMVIQHGLGLDRLYVASGFGGIDSFDLSATTIMRDPSFPWESIAQSNGEAVQAFAVAAIDVNGRRYLFVGTNDTLTESGGRIFIVEQSVSSAAPIERGFFDAHAPVYALAARTDLVANKVTLLAGTACAGKSGCGTSCGDLMRFDIPDTKFNGTPISISADLSATYGTPKGLFIRDIQILRGATVSYAYVATHGRRVRRFDITTEGQLTHQAITGSAPNDNWPALVSDPDVRVRPTSLSLIESGSGPYLVVGLGRQFSTERQNFGDCWNIQPCDETVQNPNSYGIRVLGNIDVSNQGPSIRGIFPPSNATKSDAVAGVAVREDSAGGDLLIDVAAFGEGYRLLRFDPSVSDPLLSVIEDANLQDALLKPSVDDAAIVDFGNSTQLYVATETRLVRLGDVAAASSTPGNQLSIPPASAQYSSGTDPEATWLAAQSDWKWIFAGTTSSQQESRGIRFFDVNAFDPVNVGLLDNDGSNNLAIRAVWAPALTATFPGQNGLPEKWIYAVNNTDDQSPLGRPGIRVWDVTQVIAGTRIPSASTLRAEYVEYPGVLPNPLGPDDSSRNFGDITVVDVDQNTQAVYVLFGPRAPAGGLPAEDSLGLMIFQMTVTPSAHNPPIYSLDLVDKFDALPAGGLAPGGAHPLRAHWDATNQRLFAAYSCYGSVIYDFSSGLLSSPTATFRPGNGRTAYQVAPTNTALDNVYISYLHGEIEVVPRATFATATGTVFDVARYPNQMVPDPNTGGPPAAFYLANGASGIRLVVVE